MAMQNKDIRFSDKKVDESWKDQAKPLQPPDSPKSQSSKSVHEPVRTPTSKPFLNLLTSLGYQALIHLGEAEDPMTQERSTNLEAAREVIDLLVSLKEKTGGHLSQEEERLLSNLLPELQMKFSQHV